MTEKKTRLTQADMTARCIAASVELQKIGGHRLIDLLNAHDVEDACQIELASLAASVAGTLMNISVAMRGRLGGEDSLSIPIEVFMRTLHDTLGAALRGDTGLGTMGRDGTLTIHHPVAGRA